MSWFAFTIWAWQVTGEATALALVTFFSFGPTLLFSPLAGALVDRWNRKLVMMFSDLATGLATVVILLLYITGELQIWHIYIAAIIAGAFQSFQIPAYSAAVTMMLPKEHYARAEGMIGLATSASGILGPLLSAALLGVIGFAGIMLIDIATFVFAISTLFFVHVPQPAVTEAGRAGKGNIWKESIYGFSYISRYPSLLGLQLIFAGGNLFNALGYTLVAPMILARTGNDQMVLGGVQSAAAIGGTVGAGLLIVWGGPKRRIHAILAGWALASLTGRLMIGLGHGPVAWAFLSFLSAFFTPFVNGCDQAIWQAKVAPDVQGRVFATKQLTSRATVPIGILLAGPLADHVFEPALMSGSNPAAAFQGLVGTGPGAGMALMLVFAGLLEMAIPLAGYVLPAVRNIEALLPDYAGRLDLPSEEYA
jgi:MFS family permease